MKIKWVIFLILVVGCIGVKPGPDELEQLAGAVKEPTVIVIDPGHGGPDGGAEAADGTQEKHINLSIAQAVKKEAERLGMEAVLTRENDEGLYESETAADSWKKLSDLKRRVEIIEDAKADLVVSIHLNNFIADTKVRGAQVFYPKSGDEIVRKESEVLAGLIQDSLIKGLNDGSNRIEMGKDDIYLFKDVKRPTVLVECGFLSNPLDLGNLKKKDYQKKIAKHIMEAVAKYEQQSKN